MIASASDSKTDSENHGIASTEMNTFRSRSSASSDSDLSFSLSLERELDAIVLGDELPAFEIRLISPLGRTPSPIHISQDLQTPTRSHLLEDDLTPSACLNPDFVTLQDVIAQISPPADQETSKAGLSRYNSLETIFEGVFLNTPPRKVNNISGMDKLRGNLIEKMVVNHLKCEKENQIPNQSENTLDSPNAKKYKNHSCS